MAIIVRRVKTPRLSYFLSSSSESVMFAFDYKLKAPAVLVIKITSWKLINNQIKFEAVTQVRIKNSIEV